jgi:hypothetical protein
LKDWAKKVEGSEQMGADAEKRNYGEHYAHIKHLARRFTWVAHMVKWDVTNTCDEGQILVNIINLVRISSGDLFCWPEGSVPFSEQFCDLRTNE